MVEPGLGEASILRCVRGDSGGGRGIYDILFDFVRSLVMSKQFVLGLLVFGFIGTVVQADKYEVDGVHSAVMFRVKHMDVSYSYGRFNKIEGRIKFDESKPEKSRFEIEIAAETIDTGNGNRDNHLKGPDFFNVKEFPKIVFKSKDVEKAGENKYMVSGQLMMHGKKQDVSCELEHVGTKSTSRGDKIGFEGHFVIKRSDFGMNYMVGKGLGDEVTVKVSLEADKK